MPTDEQKEAKEDADKNPRTLHDRQGRRKAKARIVLLGFQHPSLLDPTFKDSEPGAVNSWKESAISSRSTKTMGTRRFGPGHGLSANETPRLRMSTCGPQVYKSFVMPLMLARRASCGF